MEVLMLVYSTVLVSSTFTIHYMASWRFAEAEDTCGRTLARTRFETSSVPAMPCTQIDQALPSNHIFGTPDVSLTTRERQDHTVDKHFMSSFHCRWEHVLF